MDGEYRGKRINGGEWVFGYLAFNYVNGRNDSGFVLTEKSCIYDQEEARNYDVVRATIGRFTGKYDIHGDKVYEGDIVKTASGLGVVKYSNERCAFLVGEDTLLGDVKCEITGTVFERKEG